MTNGKNLQKYKNRFQQTFWISLEEKAALENIIAGVGLTRSEVFRFLVERAEREVLEGTFTMNPVSERKYTRPTDKNLEPKISGE